MLIQPLSLRSCISAGVMVSSRGFLCEGFTGLEFGVLRRGLEGTLDLFWLYGPREDF